MSSFFLLIMIIAWCIGAGTLAYEDYQEARSQAESLAFSVFTGAVQFLFWWALVAVDAFGPRLKLWWNNR